MQIETTRAWVEYALVIVGSAKWRASFFSDHCYVLVALDIWQPSDGPHFIFSHRDSDFTLPPLRPWHTSRQPCVVV